MRESEKNVHYMAYLIYYFHLNDQEFFFIILEATLKLFIKHQKMHIEKILK